MFRTFIHHITPSDRLQSLSDEELVSEYKKRFHDKILTEFFDRYVHLIYAVCMKYLKDEEKARDFTMIIFEGLKQKLKDFEVTNFKSWLYTIARNTCLMELRKKRREIPVNGNEIFKLARVETHEISHPEIEQSNDNQIRDALKMLKECQRVCIELMYFKDKSYKDIALSTGYSLKEVKSYIQNGKRNLKSLISRNNG